MKHREHVFRLKGHREYVHGTDIFDQLINNVSGGAVPVTNIEITFSRRVENTACSWYLTTDKSEVDAMSAPCRGKYQLEGVDYYFSVIPQDEQGVRTRVEYDEDEMTASSRLAESTAAVEPNSKYTFIENLVALNKHFHNHNFKLETNKWMFAKLELCTVPGDVANIEVQLERMIPNKLSKCRIIADNRELGFIFFAIG